MNEVPVGFDGDRLGVLASDPDIVQVPLDIFFVDLGTLLKSFLHLLNFEPLGLDVSLVLLLLVDLLLHNLSHVRFSLLLPSHLFFSLSILDSISFFQYSQVHASLGMELSHMNILLVQPGL